MKKKQVIEQLQKTLEDTMDRWIDTKRELDQTERFLNSAESAIRMYEKMSVFQFIKHKYAK